MSTFVTVGNANQPFRRLLDMVCALREQLPKPIIVQAGNNDFLCEGCKVVDFMSMEEFEDCMLDAEVVIMHAGAGSVLTAVRSGKHPIIMARMKQYDEHVNDHQLEFVNQIQDAGLPVSVISDVDSLVAAVSAATDEIKSATRFRHDSKLLALVTKELDNLASGKSW